MLVERLAPTWRPCPWKKKAHSSRVTPMRDGDWPTRTMQAKGKRISPWRMGVSGGKYQAARRNCRGRATRSNSPSAEGDPQSESLLDRGLDCTGGEDVPPSLIKPEQ